MSGRTAIVSDDESGPPGPARGDIPKIRRCLRCRGDHDGSGFGDRICHRCKSSAAWRDGVATTAD